MAHDDLPDLDIDAAAIEAELSGENTAAASLQKYVAGGAVLVALVQTRLEEAVSAVREGRFTDAHRHLSEADQKLVPLAQAEQGIGTFAGRTRVVRAEEVEAGMSVLGMGKVTKTERFPIQHMAGEDCWHVRLHFEDGDEHETNGKREMLVEKTNDGD